MAEKDLQITNHDFLIYRDSNNDVKVSVMLINNDIWLTQNLIAELFGVGRSTITEHINNILNRIVTMYLDYAELQAENHNAMTMKDWIEKLNVFLQFNGKEILHNAGKISAKVAQELAYREYDKFKVKQDKLYKSDFDLLLEEIDK